MPILELTFLKIKDGFSPTSPSILSSLTQVRKDLADRIHPTHSRFYTSLSFPSDIYILGTWPSLAAHHAFLSSPLKSEILGAQEDVFEFQWSIHVPIENGMEDLPLNAPVLAIARLLTKPGAAQIAEDERILGKYRHLIEDATKPHPVFDGWRCDAEEEEPESMMISGWGSEGAHDEFRERTRRENGEYAGVRDTYRGMSIVHVRDLEG
jgi:hypothetical protein